MIIIGEDFQHENTKPQTFVLNDATETVESLDGKFKYIYNIETLLYHWKFLKKAKIIKYPYWEHG